ncbi:MAG: hypothetical protein CK425_04370 [Parachlamydia sp.]|nr:MAG: hypothetical protein CK425_04370 [Parachlamydia sp.]
MRIEMKDHLNLEPLIHKVPLKPEEKAQLTQLFEKIVRKGHLGSSGAGQLSFYLEKINDPDFILVQKDGVNFILKMNESERPREIAAVNRRDPVRGKTPLHQAINRFNDKTPEDELKSLKEIEALLNNPEIDVNLTDKEGWSAAYQATQLTNSKALEMIFSHPDIKLNLANMDGSVPLIRAADRDNEEAVRLLLKAGANVNHCNDTGTALAYATRKGHANVINLLIAKGADVNHVSDCLGKTPLILAKEKGFDHIVANLEAAGGEEVTKPTELQAMVQKGGKELREYLKDDVNRTDEYQRNAAHYWAYHPTHETKDLLEDLGVDFNTQDHLKRTPLHYAAIQGHTNAAETLLRHGLEIDHGDKHGYNPLFFTAQYDRLETAEFLVACGANLGHTDKFDWTPLDKAAESNSRQVCTFLCTQGVDVNRQAQDGRIALHKAALNSSYECIQILLENGADSTIEDQQRQTPLQKCTDEGCKRLLS